MIREPELFTLFFLTNKDVLRASKNRVLRFSILHCSEAELEEVLTTYTKLNKSASIFLGSNAKPVASNRGSSTRQSTRPMSSVTAETNLNRRKESSMPDLTSSKSLSPGEGHLSECREEKKNATDT